MVHFITIKISPAPQVPQKCALCWCFWATPGCRCSNVTFSNTWWLGGSPVLWFPILLAQSALGRWQAAVGECSNVRFSNTWWLGGVPVLLKAGAMSPCRRRCPGCVARSWRCRWLGCLRRADVPGPRSCPPLGLMGVCVCECVCVHSAVDLT